MQGARLKFRGCPLTRPDANREQGAKMKFSGLLRFAMFCFALTFAASGFAADTHKANFQVSESVQVNGTELAPGDYVAKWAGDGPDVQLNILRNGKSVATVPAKLVQLDQKASSDASEVRNDNGGRQLSTLQFAGKKYSLQIGSGTREAAQRQ
jgi:hypothetical protein